MSIAFFLQPVKRARAVPQGNGIYFFNHGRHGIHGREKIVSVYSVFSVVNYLMSN
jgi:hypothetical protein